METTQEVKFYSSVTCYLGVSIYGMNVHYFNCDDRLYSLLSKLSNVNLITAADKVWSSGTNGWLLYSL